MDWTEQEIIIAKQLVEPDTLAFLRKVFVDLQTQKGEVLKVNVAALDDAEYGRLMKVLYMTREENKDKINLLKMIAKKKPSDKPASSVAPR